LKSELFPDCFLGLESGCFAFFEPAALVFDLLFYLPLPQLGEIMVV